MRKHHRHRSHRSFGRQISQGSSANAEEPFSYLEIGQRAQPKFEGMAEALTW